MPNLRALHRALLLVLLLCVSVLLAACNSPSEKEKDAIALAISGIMKNNKVAVEQISTLETKYDDNAGDWYVALGWGEK